jgi:hypothetical protein
MQGIYAQFAQAQHKSDQVVQQLVQRHVRTPSAKPQGEQADVRHTVSCYGGGPHTLVIRQPVSSNASRQKLPPEMRRSDLGFRRVRQGRCLTCGSG